MSISTGKIAECVKQKKLTGPIVVQVTNVQTIDKQPDVVKAQIHDNKYKITTIFKLKDAEKRKKLVEYTIIKITNASIHIPNQPNKTLVVAVSDFDIIDNTVKKMTTSENLIKLEKLDQISTAPSIKPGQPVSHQNTQQQDLSKNKITPFSMITSFNGSNVVIKARVIEKSDKFPYKNGDGQLFRFTLQDKDGSQTRGTCFKDQCDTWFDLLEVGKTYFISKADWKAPQNKSNRSNKMIEFDMNVSKITRIQKSLDEINEITSIVPISDLLECSIDSTYDICGCLIEKGEEIETKNGKKKLVLKVVDQTNYCVEINFWGDEIAQVENMEVGKVYVFKDCRLGEFNYKSLTFNRQSKILCDDQIDHFDETSMVNKFLSEHRSEGELTFDVMYYVSELSKSENKMNNTLTQASPLFCLKELNEQMKEKQEEMKVNVYGYFNTFKNDSGFSYVACKTCRKKVDDSKYCSKCQSEVEVERRYIVNCSIVDSTDSIWVTLFDDVAKPIFGLSADELFELYENEFEKYENIFKNCTLSQYRFHLICKTEESPEYGTRVRYTCNFCQLVDQLTDDVKVVRRKGLDLKKALIDDKEVYY